VEDKIQSVLFFINKETGKFRRYQIVEKTIEEIKPLVEKHNIDPASKDNIIIIEDQHVIDAITYREDTESLVSFMNDIKDNVSGVEDSIDSLRHTVNHAIEKIKEKLKIEEE
jgi:muramidase (phage lysozyme)